MTVEERARALRAEGNSLRKIADSMGVPTSAVYYMCGGQRAKPRGELKETAHTVVRSFPHNGGCSTLSEPRQVSLPRITALHGTMERAAA